VLTTTNGGRTRPSAYPSLANAADVCLDADSIQQYGEQCDAVEERVGKLRAMFATLSRDLRATAGASDARRLVLLLSVAHDSTRTIRRRKRHQTIACSGLTSPANQVQQSPMVLPVLGPQTLTTACSSRSNPVCDNIAGA
jgi:hypothetical protein